MLKFITLISGVLLSQLTFAAACPASTASTGTGSAFNTNCTVTGSASTIQLNFYNGFADATAISAVGGNGGTTVGAQRKLSFIKAAEILADEVQSSQSILVDADFTALSCSTNSATLGSAGASTNTGNVNPMPAAAVLNTFYPIGLINAMGNTDYQGALSDINSSFNANIGNAGCLQGSNGWYYGYDAPPSNYIGFTTVLLHEMTHGLGFASLTDASTGAKASGIDDIFSNFLYSAAASADWKAANSSNAQRAASAISSTGLLWNGSNVNTQAIGVLTAGFQDNDSSSTFTSGDRVQMYAPNPVESGSSVSHFNTAAAPNELMEPQYTAGQITLGLALQLLKDIGWGISVSSNTAPTITAVDDNTNEDIAKTIDMSGWTADADGDSLTYTVSSCAANLTCSVSGSDLTLTPAANHNGATHTITIQVSDGSASASDSFNFAVNAVPDAPVFGASSSNAQSTNEDTAKVIALSGWATDVDGDSLTYTVSSCATNITCSISGTTLTLTPDANHYGATHSISLQVSDGSLTDTATFNLAVNAQNDGPAISAVNQTTNEDTAKVVNVSSWAADLDGDTLSYSITACPANISCSVSGVNVTLTPSANHNGAAHSVTIQVSDGNGGTHSDSFNLDVTAVNDAPTISGLPDKNVAIGETKTINLSAFGTDIDGDSVSYNVSACGVSLTCSISGTTLSITANSDVGNVETVTIEIDDTNLTSTDSLDVTITATAAPSMTATIAGTALNDGDTHDIGLTTASVSISGGASPYSCVLSGPANGTSCSNISLPNSGEFAGDYTFTITDNDSDSITVTLKRPLRLVWSATSILEGDSSQTLKIEGGAASTVYNISNSSGTEVIFNDVSGNVISQTTADSNNDFNAALVYLSTEAVSGINALDVDVRVASSYDDVDQTVQVVPAISHDFTVEDTNGNAINNAKLSLTGNESILGNMNLEADYYSNASGLVSIELPDTGDSLALTTTANGYTGNTLSVDNGITTHTVTLTEMANGVTITGSISALGSQDFVAQTPSVVISYSDGTSDTIPVTVSTVSQANFTHSVDLNLKSLDAMKVNQEDSLNLEVSISSVQQDRTYNILLERHVAVVSSQPIGSSGGGSLPWYTLLLLPLFIRFKRAKK